MSTLHLLINRWFTKILYTVVVGVFLPIFISTRNLFKLEFLLFMHLKFVFLSKQSWNLFKSYLWERLVKWVTLQNYFRTLAKQWLWLKYRIMSNSVSEMYDKLRMSVNCVLDFNFVSDRKSGCLAAGKLTSLYWLPIRFCFYSFTAGFFLHQY